MSFNAVSFRMKNPNPSPRRLLPDSFWRVGRHEHLTSPESFDHVQDGDEAGTKKNPERDMLVGWEMCASSGDCSDYAKITRRGCTDAARRGRLMPSPPRRWKFHPGCASREAVENPVSDVRNSSEKPASFARVFDLVSRCMCVCTMYYSCDKL